MVKKKWESHVKIEIDHDVCAGHGECVDICPMGVYELVDNKAVPSNIEECIECCACVSACPVEAIEHSSC